MDSNEKQLDALKIINLYLFLLIHLLVKLLLPCRFCEFHTTAIYRYAIAQCLRDKQKVIYTSPIKALSNQKYRELEQEFGDVGLMTGFLF